MRGINEHFTDTEFRKLKQVKGNRTWREAILDEFEIDGGADE